MNNEHTFQNQDTPETLESLANLIAQGAEEDVKKLREEAEKMRKESQS